MFLNSSLSQPQRSDKKKGSYKKNCTSHISDKCCHIKVATNESLYAIPTPLVFAICHHSRQMFLTLKESKIKLYPRRFSVAF